MGAGRDSLVVVVVFAALWELLVRKLNLSLRLSLSPNYPEIYLLALAVPQFSLLY